MKPVTKAKSVGRGKITAKRPVTAKKPKTAPKKSPPKKKIAVVPPGLAFGEFEALRKQMDLSLDELTARLGLSSATVAQRKAAGRLTNDESGKVVCFARLSDMRSISSATWRRHANGSRHRSVLCMARCRSITPKRDGRAGSREPVSRARRLQPCLRLRIDPFRRTNLRLAPLLCRRICAHRGAGPPVSHYGMPGKSSGVFTCRLN